MFISVYILRLYYRYTIVCPPICGENPRALASGLSPVQMDKLWYMYYFLYHLHQCKTCKLIVHAKVGKGGIK